MITVNQLVVSQPAASSSTIGSSPSLAVDAISAAPQGLAASTVRQWASRVVKKPERGGDPLSVPPFTRTRQPSHEEKKRWPSNHPTPMPEPRRKGSGRRGKTSNIPSIASALHASPAPAVWDEATRSRCSSPGEKLASSLALVDMVHQRQLPPSRVHYQPASP
jgi:hypothetical protein